MLLISGNHFLVHTTRAANNLVRVISTCLCLFRIRLFSELILQTLSINQTFNVNQNPDHGGENQLLVSAESHPQLPLQIQESRNEESSTNNYLDIPTETPSTQITSHQNSPSSNNKSPDGGPVDDQSESQPKSPDINSSVSLTTSPSRTPSPRLRARTPANSATRSPASSPARSLASNPESSLASSPVRSPIRSPSSSTSSSPVRSPIRSPSSSTSSSPSSSPSSRTSSSPYSIPSRSPSRNPSRSPSRSPINSIDPPRNDVEEFIDSPWESPPRSPWESAPGSPWESAPGSPWESAPGSPWESPPRIHWDDSSSVLEESDESDQESFQALNPSSVTSTRETGSATSSKAGCLIFQSWKSIGIQVQTKYEPIHTLGRNCRGIIVADRDSDSDDDYEPGTGANLIKEI